MTRLFQFTRGDVKMIGVELPFIIYIWSIFFIVVGHLAAIILTLSVMADSDEPIIFLLMLIAIVLWIIYIISITIWIWPGILTPLFNILIS